MWDSASAVVGILIGVAIGLFIVWLLYITRAFVFSTCAVQYPVCSAQDYYENPGDAILNGSNIDNILFITPSSSNVDTMVYLRQPKVNTCTPSSANQTVVVQYPQWCEFTDTASNKYQAENLSFNSSVYSYKDNLNNTITVNTYNGGQCIPKSSTSSVVISGTPILRWQPY